MPSSTNTSTDMRVLVCGGRNFNDHTTVHCHLDRFHARNPITLLIEGGATGADELARLWARRTGIPQVTFWANWRGEHRAAGTLRNKRMIDLLPPDLVIAFPGGAGTRNMMSLARAANIKVFVAPAYSRISLAVNQGGNGNAS